MSVNENIKELLNKSDNQKLKEIRENENTFLAFDGIVNEEVYEKAPLKVTYLLKEVNDPEMKENWDFITTLYKHINSDETLYKTWPNLCMWTGLLFKDCNYYEECIMPSDKIFDAKKYREYLNRIAIVNLKKTPGGGSSKWNEIEDAVSEYGNVIKEELEIIDSNLIVCGGTFYFAKKIYKVSDNIDIKTLKTGTEYFIKDKKIFLSFVHPMWYQVDRKILFAYAKETFNALRDELKDVLPSF